MIPLSRFGAMGYSIAIHPVPLLRVVVARASRLVSSFNAKPAKRGRTRRNTEGSGGGYPTVIYTVTLLRLVVGAVRGRWKR